MSIGDLFLNRTKTAKITRNHIRNPDQILYVYNFEADGF